MTQMCCLEKSLIMDFVHPIPFIPISVNFTRTTLIYSDSGTGRTLAINDDCVHVHSQKENQTRLFVITIHTIF